MKKPLPIWRALGVALAILSLFALVLPAPQVAVAQDWFAPSYELTGPVERPKTFTQADLAAYPSVTLTVAFGAGQGFQTGRYTGVQLWDLLQEAGVKLDPARNSDKLRKYVVVTGSDNYDAVFAYTELDPDFGAEMVLVAYAKDGQPLGPAEGMARTVISSDKRGGRLVSNVIRIEVRDLDSPPRAR